MLIIKILKGGIVLKMIVKKDVISRSCWVSFLGTLRLL